MTVVISPCPPICKLRVAFLAQLAASVLRERYAKCCIGIHDSQLGDNVILVPSPLLGGLQKRPQSASLIQEAGGGSLCEEKKDTPIADWNK